MSSTALDAPEVPAADGFDPLVVNPGRLGILMALVEEESADDGVEFVTIRRRTRLTDGNLASHAKRLADGGLIGIDKRFRDGKPVTTYLLTDAGRTALQSHVRRVMSAVGGTTLTAPAVVRPARAVAAEPADDWVD